MHATVSVARTACTRGAEPSQRRVGARKEADTAADRPLAGSEGQGLVGSEGEGLRSPCGRAASEGRGSKWAAHALGEDEELVAAFAGGVGALRGAQLAQREEGAATARGCGTFLVGSGMGAALPVRVSGCCF